MGFMPLQSSSPLIDRLNELESDILYQQDPSELEPEFVYQPGRIPILLSAPHGAVHTRNGKPKDEDEFTSGFARLVAELTGAHVIYTRRKSIKDPNRDNDSPYKDELAKIVRENPIRFALDIHGAKQDHNFGIALGTMGNRSCPDQYDAIIQTLSANGFQLDATELDHLAVDLEGYKAEGQGTVTRFVSTQLSVPAAQFELNAHLRTVERRLSISSATTPFLGDTARIKRVIHAFVDLVNVLMDEK
jgi:hypothetical protein